MEADFVKSVAKDPELLAKVLENVATNSRRTLVVVIDQAEEVVTLRPGSNGDAARVQFLDFLYYISRSKHDLKVIVTMRTEYHGQFYAQLRYGMGFGNRTNGDCGLANGADEAC